MRQMLRKVNQGYDKIGEPWRFLLMNVLFVAIWFVFLMGFVALEVTESLSVASFLAVVVSGVLMLLIRIPYVHGWLVPKE
jgi:hypothetical protein